MTSQYGYQLQQHTTVTTTLDDLNGGSAREELRAPDSRATGVEERGRGGIFTNHNSTLRYNTLVLLLFTN